MEILPELFRRDIVQARPQHESRAPKLLLESRRQSPETIDFGSDVAKAAIPGQLRPQHDQVVFLAERGLELLEFCELCAQAGHQAFGKAKLVPEILHAFAPVVEIWSPPARLRAHHGISALAKAAPQDSRQVGQRDRGRRPTFGGTTNLSQSPSGFCETSGACLRAARHPGFPTRQMRSDHRRGVLRDLMPETRLQLIEGLNSGVGITHLG